DKATVVIEKAPPVEAILRAVDARGPELVIIGVARNELLGRFLLGRTVDKLLRRCRVPILVVRNRPHRHYRYIVVATDFSESSRCALDAALRLFPKARLTLFHAAEPPMSRLDASHKGLAARFREFVESPS